QISATKQKQDGSCPVIRLYDHNQLITGDSEFLYCGIVTADVWMPPSGKPVRTSSDSSCIGGSEGLYFHYHRRPKVERGGRSGEGTLLTVTALSDLRTRKCSGPHPSTFL